MVMEYKLGDYVVCEDRIGIQQLVFADGDIMKPNIVMEPDLFNPNTTYIPVTIYDLAANDGLSTNDWLDWFKNYDLTKPMAIIHFTKFRYQDAEVKMRPNSYNMDLPLFKSTAR